MYIVLFCVLFLSKIQIKHKQQQQNPKQCKPYSQLISFDFCHQSTIYCCSFSFLRFAVHLSLCPLGNTCMCRLAKSFFWMSKSYIFLKVNACFVRLELVKHIPFLFCYRSLQVQEKQTFFFISPRENKVHSIPYAWWHTHTHTYTAILCTLLDIFLLVRFVSFRSISFHLMLSSYWHSISLLAKYSEKKWNEMEWNNINGNNHSSLYSKKRPKKKSNNLH